MIGKKMEDAINEQINAEMFSSYLYLSMSAFFADKNLPGFANWMQIQAQEELLHAMKLYDYLIERGGRVILADIKASQSEWDSPIAVFKHVYEHEQKVTGLINNLVNIAIEEKDHAANSYLQWFVNEQVEEEASADGVVKKLEMISDSTSGLFMMDQELGKRIFTPPAASENT
jgi:ferritin